jgi:hypothetical protein
MIATARSASRPRSRWLLPLLLGAVVMAAPSVSVAKGGGHVFLGLSTMDLKLDIDDTLDIAGPTRFFSSRHRMYAGGRLTTHFGDAKGRTFYVGQFFGFGWGKSSFLLNWETPGVISYPPLDADITWGYFPWGIDANLVLGDVVHLAAFGSVKWIFQKLTIDIGGEDFTGTVHKLVGAYGAMATVNLGVVRVSGGASINHFLNADVDWEVDDLTFASRHTDPSVEYFVGVVLK